jgi:hypothetical protein
MSLSHDILAAAVLEDANSALRREAREVGDGAARPLAHQVVERAPDEQEEQQHGRRIEIGVRPRDHRLEEAQQCREDDADGDRHVHVGAAHAQRAPGRAEERPAGIGDGGQCDQRRDPVEEIARRLVRAGPDRDGEQHDVAGGEARDRHCRHQLAHHRVALALGGGIDHVVVVAAGADGRRKIGGEPLAGSKVTRTRRLERLTRAASTCGSAQRPVSMLRMQEAQCASGTANSSCRVPSPSGRLSATSAAASFSTPPSAGGS